MLHSDYCKQCKGVLIDKRTQVPTWRHCVQGPGKTKCYSDSWKNDWGRTVCLFIIHVLYKHFMHGGVFATGIRMAAVFSRLVSLSTCRHERLVNNQGCLSLSKHLYSDHDWKIKRFCFFLIWPSVRCVLASNIMEPPYGLHTYSSIHPSISYTA